VREEEFVGQVRRNRANREILARLPELALPQAFLVAGCVFQTIWNIRSGRPPDQGIKDYDIFYFDDGDLSWAAEDRIIRSCCELFADLGVVVEARNQARVHLWYEQHFGVAYPRLTSTPDGIDRFLISCTCVGIRPRRDDTVELYAPHGLDELYAGILRPNPVNDQPRLFQAKVASYRARWPWLNVVTS
jgi:uncharacterized protein